MTFSKWLTYSFAVLLGGLLCGAAIDFQPFGLPRSFSLIVAVATAAVALSAALFLRRVSIKLLLGGFSGLLAGCLLSLVIILVLNTTGLRDGSTSSFLRVAAPAVLAYVGFFVGISKSSYISLINHGTDEPDGQLKLLDTSVLIDGRVCDVIESSFLDGTLAIPRFVLHELQLVADSSDSTRRVRGRRGLDVVQHLQSLPNVAIEISEQDFPSIREVDLKLIEMAKLRGAKIVTNDFNLNKLAQVQGIQVLNINQLANSLRPVVLPGETMRVFILKEGKEHNQGVAYLEDGTMVVVDNARRQISKNVEVVVTSVLQTTAGKMIFGRYDERPHREDRPVSASAAS